MDEFDAKIMSWQAEAWFLAGIGIAAAIIVLLALIGG